MNVVITGASKGIGRAIAEKFARQGDTLFLCARNGETLSRAAAEIKKAYPQCAVEAMPADLSKKEEADAFADYCLGFGTPDILVNNTGSFTPGTILGEPEGALENMINTNLYSAYRITKKLAPAMVRSGSGHIFNICSVASLQAYENGGSYSISKYALNGFSQNLRNELKAHGIKVTAVFLGAVLTDSWGNYDNSSKRIMEVEDVAEMIYAATRLSPQAVVEDIILRPQLGDL